MISILFLLFSIISSFVEYRLLKNNSELFQERIIEHVIKTVSKIMFGLIFLNLVPISMWHYMRKHDFISSEILHEIELFNYIGWDFLILNTAIFILPILPIKSKDRLNKAIGWFFLLLILVMIIWGLIWSTSYTMPLLFLYVSAGLYFWANYDDMKRFSSIIALNNITKQQGIVTETKNTTENNNYFISIKIILSILILFGLIFIPNSNLEKMTENTLRRMKLGGFTVKLKTDDKQIIEGILLLKTTSFYYINPINNGEIKSNVVQIIHTGNTTLTYEKIPEKKKEGK